MTQSNLLFFSRLPAEIQIMSRRLYSIFCLLFALLNFSASFKPLLFSSREYCIFSRCLIHISTKTSRKLNAYIELFCFTVIVIKLEGIMTWNIYIYTYIYIQGVPWLVDINTGGEFQGLCDQKSSYKHVSDFERLRSYDRLKLRIECNDYWQ